MGRRFLNLVATAASMAALIAVTIPTIGTNWVKRGLNGGLPSASTAVSATNQFASKRYAQQSSIRYVSGHRN
jgi:hypothetical protein